MEAAALTLGLGLGKGNGSHTQEKTAATRLLVLSGLYCPLPAVPPTVTGAKGTAIACFVAAAAAERRMFKSFVEEHIMNWDQIQGNWKQFTGKVKEKWGKLTDDDLTTIAGKRDQLAGKLQTRYGIAKNEAEKQLDDFAKALK
jgi:uncharacterized protein YjbJ (UPF0337 family)